MASSTEDDTVKLAGPTRDTVEDTVPGYRIEGELGRGGMGAVYRAVRISTGETLALKVVRPDKADPTFAARFEREIIAAQRIPSPHVVRVVDYAIEPVAFAAMEIVDGGSLRDLQVAHRRLPVALMLRLADDLLAGLGAAHAEGVVHRDVKPQNLLVTRGGLLKVADFGVARVMDQSSLTSTGGVLGTPAYMSPEQLRGERVDVRSDLFGAGIVIFELITGEHPFKTGDPATTMRRIVQLVHKTAAEAFPAIPDDIDAFIERFLAQSDKRYQSATQARAALAPLLARHGGSRGDVAEFLEKPKVMRDRLDARLRDAQIRVARAALVGSHRDAAMATTQRLLMTWPADAEVRALAREVQAKTVMLRPSSAALALLRRAENEEHPIPTLREAVRSARQDNDLHLERVASARILQLMPDDEESSARVRPLDGILPQVTRIGELTRRFIGFIPDVSLRGQRWAGKVIGGLLAVVCLATFSMCAYCAGFGTSTAELNALLREAKVLQQQGRCEEAFDKLKLVIDKKPSGPHAEAALAQKRAPCQQR